VKITIEPTDQFADFTYARCRMWKGTTEAGVTVFAFITAISARTSDDQGEFAVLQNREGEMPSEALAVAILSEMIEGTAPDGV
jgi:hypothetical protein